MSRAHALAAGSALVEGEIRDPGATPPPAPRKRGRPKKMSRQVAAVIALRLEGHDNSTIARMLGLRGPQAVSQLIYRARQQGGFNDILDRVDGLAIPQAVENLIAGLRDGDKEYTLEALKGRGIFRNHNQIKSEGGGGGGNTLLVKIEMPVLPAGVAAPQIGDGQIVGAPRVIVAQAPPPALPEPPVVEAVLVEAPDAVQVAGPARVDAREQAGDGRPVGSGDGPGPDAPPARPSPDADLDAITARFAQAAFAPGRGGAGREGE